MRGVLLRTHWRGVEFGETGQVAGRHVDEPAYLCQSRKILSDRFTSGNRNPDQGAITLARIADDLTCPPYSFRVKAIPDSYRDIGPIDGSFACGRVAVIPSRHWGSGCHPRRF